MSIHSKPNPQRFTQLQTKLDALLYAHKVWEAIDTPISLSCSLLLKYGEHAQLVRKSVDPKQYRTPSDFFVDYQSVKLLSKYPYLKTGIDTKQVAYEKFLEGEAQCFQTNSRFRQAQTAPFSEQLERILCATRAKIASILGRVPSLSEMDFSFGPGAAYGVRRETSVYNKVVATLECTYAMSDNLQVFLEEFPGWFPDGDQQVKLLPGSQLTFVPKDAKTDRPICIEPLLNGLMQKGIGTWIRRRLKRHGVNLDDQTVNQRLASVAHLESLATVDFSSASDTISYLVVMDLLPIDWFEFLDVARCPRFEYEGKWSNFQKFSSMGNAYTFELESLIFYALAFACVQEAGIEPRTGVNLSVYGDDVIIPQRVFDLFREVSSVCGFTVSAEKSFHEGVFFESCGHDYYLGVLVRPFLIKKRITPLLQAFYATNTIVRLAHRIPKGSDTLHLTMDRRSHVDRRLRDVHRWCILSIPTRLRAYGPEGLGDGHIIAEVDSCRPTRHPTWDGWYVRSYVEEPVTVSRLDWPLAYALYFTRHQGEPPKAHLGWDTISVDNGSGYAVRGRTRTRLKKIFTPSWSGYPNWSDFIH